MRNDKIAVVVGKAPSWKKVSCQRFVSGLVLNLSPDRHKSARLYNITHVHTGVSILNYVPIGTVSSVKSLLQKEDWSLSLGEIFSSNKHRQAVEEVIKYMADRESSKKQEKKVASDLKGGKVQPASGSRWGYKRDVVTPEFLIEVKITDSSSMSIVQRDLTFLKKQAYLEGKIPVYIAEVRGESVAILPKEDVYPHYIEKITPIGIRGKKSFPIDKRVFELVEDGAVEVSILSGRYLIIDYLSFLKLAKGEHYERGLI